MYSVFNTPTHRVSVSDFFLAIYTVYTIETADTHSITDTIDTADSISITDTIDTADITDAAVTIYTYP